MERASTSANGRFSFGVFGDGPYYPEEIPRFNPLLEAFGSPEIGRVRVVVDSDAGRIIEIEPRLVRE